MVLHARLSFKGPVGGFAHEAGAPFALDARTTAVTRNAHGRRAK